MRTCQSCGRENPPDRDFCECGEYLRWEATGIVQAVTPEVLKEAVEQAPPPKEPDPPAPVAPAEPAPAAGPPPPAAPTPAPPAQVQQAPPAPPPPGNGHDTLAPAPPAVPKTAVQQAVPQPPAPAPAAEEAAGASITLRLPDGDPAHGETLALGVEPGQTERVLALIRNQSGIVDNYVLRVEGLPDGWASIYPDTVYLVPFGSSGTYEQEVEIHFHPPRAPEAESRIWDLRVVAHSKANNVDAAAQELKLGIQPYVETGMNVRPQRAKGRRKADYTVDVSNKANAPVVVALEGTDPDGELQFGFDRPPAEIKPGDTVQTSMRVKPPKQIWIGRPVEKRFEVKSLTGEEAAERLAAEPESAEGGPSPAKRRGRFRIPGFSSPAVYKPQLYEPGVSIGPGGIQLRKPQLRGPQVRAPQMQAKNLQLSQLKMPGRGGAAPAAPAAPLLPSQGVFKQKAWLPWWLIPVLALLIALLLLLYMLLPKNVIVPDVVGSPSAFEAEQALTEAELALAPQQQEEPTDEEEPGTVIGQDPPAGEEAEKGAEVSLLIAVGTGNVEVPDITGLTPTEAEQALREEKLSLGQANVQPVDPEGEIESQIPAPKEVVKEGTPVDIFFPEAGEGEGGGQGEGEGEGEGGGAGGAGGGGAGGGEGGGAAAEIVVPAIEGAPTEEYAQKVADLGLIPASSRVFDESDPNTLFGTEPPGGTTVEAGSTVTLLVSGGFPQLVFDNDKDILRVNGATGRRLDPVADGPAREKDPAFSFDGTRVAYVGGRRVFLDNLERPDATAVPLTADTDEFADLAWAPTLDVNLLAMGRIKGDDRDLCLGQITGDGMTPECINESEHTVGGFHWAPNGKSILAGGVNPKDGTFGIVRWRTSKAFSPDPADWSKGKFVTDTSVPGSGVIEAAISPNGKRLALVARDGNRPFRLVLAKNGDFAMSEARQTQVRACKVQWRPDGRELVVKQADELCVEEVGSLVRVPVNDPSKETQITGAGDNPVFEPLKLDDGG